MKVLALETATLAGSVALVDDRDGLISEVKVNIRVAHSERLMPSVEWVLNSSGCPVSSVDVFAVSIGPGSFTGLRIGLSTAKGLAFATGKPVVPVPTLDALARAVPFIPHLVCPMLDARKSQVFAALYRWEGQVCRKILPETAIPIADLLRGLDETVLFLGEGARINRDLIHERMAERAVFAPPHAMNPSAATVAGIALEQARDGITVDPVSLAPLYIRRSEAEVNWKA